MKLLKRDRGDTIANDAALERRLEAVVSRSNVERAIHERREPIPSSGGY